jgi:hypothetical protein
LVDILYQDVALAILFTCLVSQVAYLSVVWVAILLGVGVKEADTREGSGHKQQLIVAQSRLDEVLCSKRRAYALLRERLGGSDLETGASDF